jgi:RNA polymerase sigma-70 factor (ECF subfamily)
MFKISELKSRTVEKLSSREEVRGLEEELLQFYDQFRLRLLRYSTSLGLKMQDAEDVIHEAFLALFHHLESGKPRNNLAGWIFRVTHHMALKRRSQYLREDFGRSDERSGILSDVPNPEEDLLFNERQTRLRRVFDALPEVDRLCLQLRAEGLKYREIAEVLGISLGGVANSLGRSLERLRRSEGGDS